MSPPQAYSEAALKIIRQQETIIGPLAFDQARKVAGVQIGSNGQVTLSGDARSILENLVKQFEQFFGQASVEVCKDAVREVKPPLPPDDLPEILR